MGASCVTRLHQQAHNNKHKSNVQNTASERNEQRSQNHSDAEIFDYTRLKLLKLQTTNFFLNKG